MLTDADEAVRRHLHAQSQGVLPPRAPLALDQPYLQATVGRTAAEVLRQHREALEELRVVFNALEAKQRTQAALWLQQRRAVDLLGAALEQHEAVLSASVWRRLRWVVRGA